MEDSMDKKIVIALDQSPHSKNAVRYAAAMAPSLPGIRFCLLHVQPPVSQYLVEEAQRNPTAKAKLNRWLEKNSRAALEMLEVYKEQMVLLGISADGATPNDVLRAILMAEVDLLWFGGIGTYVRDSNETDEQASDRSNDAIRITGAQVCAKVIGEGANLAVTQHGRIEAARQGVRLNADFIDNSAGVNTSDQEVNIKIALAQPLASGRLAGFRVEQLKPLKPGRTRTGVR